MVQILVGACVAFVFALAATPVWTRYLKSHSLGQPIQAEVTQHAAKSGTPTMGGLVISVAAVVAYLIARAAAGEGPTLTGTAVVVAIGGAGLAGAVDDWLKVRHRRNLGLREAQKSVALVAVVAGYCAIYLAGPHACTNVSVTTCQSTTWNLGPAGWALLALVLIWATANSTNFTDGVEGLLAGSAIPSFGALAAIAFWQFRHPVAFHLADPLSLAVIAAAMTGACAGFLWWNIQPAHIFMGDTGSLAIGAGLAALTLSMSIAALLPILAALYVAEGASSALQRYTYKLYFKKRPGQRRLFRMAPLHHHFELKGWAEPTIITRFWLVSSIAAVGAASIFYGATIHWR